MRAFLAGAALALSLLPAFAQKPQHTMVNADEVQWKEDPPILATAPNEIKALCNSAATKNDPGEI